MSSSYSSADPKLPTVIVDALQRYAIVRSVAYGVGMNLIGYGASHIFNASGEREWSMTYMLAVHAVATPFMGLLTLGFVKLRPEDVAWATTALRRHAIGYFSLGITLGSCAYLLQTATSLLLGWVSFPRPGWHEWPSHAIGRTLVSHLGNVLLAWNEESIYRGYGLHSLGEAITIPAAAAVLIPLFAWGHGEGWPTFVGQAAMGIATTTLVLTSGSLWLPVGYHAAWNYVQTAIMGPPDASPSLYPMQVDGPRLWVGRPGYPEPGLLATLIHLIITAAAIFTWWQSKKTSESPH